jgi:hypothetical protein
MPDQSIATPHATILLVGRRHAMVGYAKVDRSDAEELSRHEWHLFRDGNGDEYAYRRDGRGRRIWMHRHLFGLTPDQTQIEVDHENRDTLDNRRSNLRVVTHAQNMQNRPSHAGSTSKFRGVYQNRNETRWRAQVVINGKTHKLGTHATEEEAAQVASSFRAAHMPFSTEAAA